MLKKSITIITVMCVVMTALAACGSKQEAAAPAPANETTAEEVTATPAPEETATPTPEATPAPEDADDASDTDEDAPKSDVDPDDPAHNQDEEYDGPADFVQEQAGKTEFKDYDEVISYLKPGQGWAKVKVNGYDDDILAVAEEIASDGSSASASFYVQHPTIAVEMTYVGSNDPKYPLRYADGLIYSGDAHTYESEVMSVKNKTLIVKDLVSEGTDEYAGEFSGFLRPSNDFGDDQDFTGGQDEFDKMIKDRDSKPILKFTVVK